MPNHRSPYKKISPNARVIELYEATVSTKNIAIRLGLTKSHVCQIIRDYKNERTDSESSK